jgi:hypothetical protein
MVKVASVILASSLGIAGLAHSTPAESHPFAHVGVGFPLVEPLALAPAYFGRGYYGYSPYWRPGYVRFGHERFYRRWYRR